MRRSVIATTFAILVATSAHAQTWIALDAQPAGTPATIILNAALSSQSTSVFDVTIHGFYVTQKLGSDAQTYQDIQVPGLPNKAQHGAPNLPVVRVDLGIVNGGDQA